MKKSKSWADYKISGSLEDRNRVIECYLGLAKYVSQGMRTQGEYVYSKEDAYSTCLTVLIDAVEKYDDSLGRSFEEYASFRMRSGIRDELRRVDRLSRKHRSDLREYLKTCGNDMERASELDMSEEELHSSLIKFPRYETSITRHEDAAITDRMDLMGLCYTEEHDGYNEMLDVCCEFLPHKMRNIFNMRWRDRMSRDQIVEKTGKSLSSIASYLFRSMEILRQNKRTIAKKIGRDFSLSESS